jgi:hypothetical protein
MTQPSVQPQLAASPIHDAKCLLGIKQRAEQLAAGWRLQR